MNSLRSRPVSFRLGALGVVGASVLLAPMLGGTIVKADPIEDQRNRVEQITDQLEELEREADILAEELVVATDELQQLEADLAEAEEAVAEQEAAVGTLRGELGEVAVQAYMGAGSSGLGPMFGSTDELNAELQRDELSRVALRSGTATSDDLERELNQLAEDKEELEEQRQAAEDKREQVADAQSATEERNAEYQEARQEAEAELGELIAEEEERRARESYERMQAEAAAAQAQAEAQQRQAEAQQQATTARPSGGNSNTNTGGGNTNTGGGNTNTGGGGAAPAPAAPATPPPAAPSIPPASSQAGTAVNAALSEQGTPYRFAAASPGVAFDCSGLTSWAWGRAGVYLPHQSAQQYASIPHVPAASAQPGDLIFYYSPISHVGLYIGGGQMVHAPNSGSVVNVTSVNWGNVVGVGRPG